MKWRSLEESGPSIDTRSLQEIFAERKELIAKYIPAETQAIHAQAVAELKARQLAAAILPVGAKAPDFELPDHNGAPVNSSALRAKGRLVLCFIRGRWCPFCVGQMEAMNLVVPQIEEAGATLRRHLSANGEAVVLHARPAQAAFSLALRYWKQVARQFGLTYRVTASAGNGLPPRFREPSVHEWR